MRKQFHSVVVIRIVRSGNHDPGLKIVFTHQASHARRGNHAGELGGSSPGLQSRRQQPRNVRPRFPRIHPDQRVCRGKLFFQILADRSPGGEQRGVIERRCTRYAAHPVRAK